ncbi:MAG: 50S ribosomal protein L18 [Planctomycetota bacterium]|jgi:large subunit ribosomal protein L18
MDANQLKSKRRWRRHRRVRRKLSGTAEKPRLSVYRSIKHIYVQVIDDEKGHTLVACSSLEKPLRAELKGGGNVPAALAVGKQLAKKALDAGIKTVAFDRGGYRYHGRVKALAEAARESGLNF